MVMITPTSPTQFCGLGRIEVDYDQMSIILDRIEVY